jgi:hypothetical protein
MTSACDEAGVVGRSVARLRELPFASCYVYSPGDARRASRLLCASVKAGLVTTLVERAIRAQVGRSASITCFFPAAAILVPVPGSVPSAWGAATASGRLAVALAEHGLGKAVWFGLRRVRAVRKSATAAPGARPSIATHVDTMAIDPAGAPDTAHLVLIDDVVTKGRTLWAAAVRLREVFPHAELRAFALLRTVGYAPVPDESFMPCTGKIELTCGDARRSP